ncbi:hypothetical protein L6654_08720 [Bradyrhizobium sp. WYCCWR 13023]|uniref:Uncharacterized protein n=1 Tax=Bradyrhizobium zhengyangense TaxID=2911009 RepID=A0A9X1R896_9BRAD|nr:hypothetical protein [Bradyrhizobium zhengyangense]MCG2626703.1 hypothetical protein [Bradyrhizobium zhengyangense]MCG2638209.1 hypothetical protein [Bradyrhizobium zhengyangense]MCG2666608.1 hypothetical protein [Bradyrhizobium zhengyangense]
MHRYVARANVDHYLEILKDTNLTTQRRSTTIALLIAELDKLGEDGEHLEFAETKVAGSRQLVAQAASRRDSLALGTSEREDAERRLIHLENVHTVLDDFCHRLRHRIGSRPA